MHRRGGRPPPQGFGPEQVQVPSLYVPGDADNSHNLLPPDIPITRSGFCLLGSPIGPAQFSDSIVEERGKKIESAVANLRDLEEFRMKTTLLRSCLSLPKFNFALRSCPPAHIQLATTAFDALMRNLAGGPLSDWAWKKAFLPSSMGRGGGG